MPYAVQPAAAAICRLQGTLSGHTEEGQEPVIAKTDNSPVATYHLKTVSAINYSENGLVQARLEKAVDEMDRLGKAAGEMDPDVRIVVSGCGKSPTTTTTSMGLLAWSIMQVVRVHDITKKCAWRQQTPSKAPALALEEKPLPKPGE